MKATFIFLLLVPLLLFGQTLKYSRVIITYDSLQKDVLFSLGLPLDHIHLIKGKIEVELSSSDLKLLDNSNIQYDVLVDDLTKYYSTRATTNNSRNGSHFLDCNNISHANIVVPNDFSLGSMGGFFTYNEMLFHLDNMASKYPNLITLKQEIGSFRTHENRPIYYVKISDNPNVNEHGSESQVLYNAIHHAREPMSMSQLIFYMYYLLENYGIDDQVTHIVNNLELFFVPCINPDGYIYNETIAPSGGGLWRKNRRDNGDGTFGVDLNRNYGYDFAKDDVGSVTSSDIYRGPSAFSEPETQAIKYLCENNDFKLTLNYHSFSNLLLIPDEFVEDSIRYLNFAEAITYNNKYTVGTGMSTLGYSANGGSNPWMYKERTTKTKQYAFTPEVGKDDDGFWPTSSRIIPLAQENIEANINMALLASNYLDIEEKSEFSISKSGTLNIELNNFGLLNPSTAVVSVHASSTQVKTIGAPVTLNGFVDLGVKQVGIDFVLQDNLLESNLIDFEVRVDFGNVILTRNFKKLYSTQYPAFEDDFNANLINEVDWNINLLGSWGRTTEDYYTAPSCITDSPNSNYLPGLNNVLLYRDKIDLTNSNIKEAFINFNAKWRIEKGYDYVQVIVNDGNQNYPMCGNYTTLGVRFSPKFEEPLYDGINDEWVNENIDLSDFLGKEISVTFVMSSDAAVEEDGFYLDDFKLFLVKERVNGVENETNNMNLFKIYPNPLTNSLYIEVDDYANLEIYNTLGISVKKDIKLNSGSNKIDVSGLKQGFYSAVLEKENIRISKRFIKK